MALSGGDDKISIEGLTPGTTYEFAVHVTSGNMTSEPYLVKGVKTCEHHQSFYPDRWYNVSILIPTQVLHCIIILSQLIADYALVP